MLKMKRVVAFTLLLAMLFSMLIAFGGCKKTDPKSTASQTKSGAKSTVKTSSSTKKSSTSGTGTKDSTKASGDIDGENGFNEDEDGEGDGNFDDYEEVIPDLDGRTIFILNQAGAAGPFLPPEEPNLIAEINYESYAAAEQKYNCKFERVISQPTGWFDIASFYLTDMLAGLNSFDILVMHTRAEIIKLITKGYLLQLDDYVNQDNYIYNDYRSVTTWQDKLWGLVSGSFSEIGVPNFVTYYKKDLITSDGLQDIEEIARAGEWTWGRFLDHAIQTTKDLNGDGIIDQWGIYAQPYVFFDAMMQSNGVQFMKTSSEDGRVECAFNSPESMRTLQQLAEFNLIHKVLVGGNFQNGPFQQGKAAMTIGPPLWYPQFFVSFDIGPLGYAPVPKGPDVNEYTNIRTDNQFICFPHYLEEPENIVKVYLDVLDKTEQYTQAGITKRDEDYQWCLNNTDTEENANVLFNWYDIFKTAPVTSQLYRGINSFQALVTPNLISPTMNGKAPVVTNVEATLPLIQAQIDDIFK